MDQCQIEGIDELKIHHETNMKSIKNINIKKNSIESDHRTPKRKNDISNSNTLKRKKKYENALAAIFPENDQSYFQYAQDYAEGYMKKMRERLDIESFDLAIKLLASFGDANDGNINLLYQQITEVFTKKNEDLIYEFLGLLLPGQALSIGKFTDYLEVTRIKEFIRKLQVCMKKQPTQVRKILDNLFNISTNKNITPLEVHSTMLPLLKSNPILVDCFFQLIPTEHPPESLYSDDNWEDLDIDQSINCGIDYEEIIPSDLEDHTLLNMCHCVCHKPGHNTHCRSCGLKFFKGRIYFDTPEGLKLAKISFEGADSSIVQSKIDKTEVNVTVKQKNRKGLIKNSSPGSAEDIKGSTGTESEEDLIDVKPKKRQKSKVVQSLKLKFKKEKSPKCKDDQEINNETGKSVVHVTNEDFDSSEMVFFCIPETESSVKRIKKKLKVDIKENVMQKECVIINQINSETSNLDNLNLVVSERNNEINTKDSLDINTVKNVSKNKAEIICIPQTVIIDNAQEIDSKQNKIELTNQSLFINSDLYKYRNSSSNMCQKPLDESITSNKRNKKQFDDQNSKLTSDNYFTTADINEYINTTIKSELENVPGCYVDLQKQDNKSVTTDVNQSLINENIPIKSEFENLPLCYVDVQKQDNESTTMDIDKSLLEDNIEFKDGVIENVPKCYVDIPKQENNDFEKQLINKWTIEENITKNELENLPECYASEQKQDNELTTMDIDKSLLKDNIEFKNEVIENVPDCYVDIPKQENNDSEKQLINKWTIDEDKIILQTCKRVEDIEVLLETINRRIPQRSVSEIQERFTTLMTLLEKMVDVKQN